MLGIVHVHNGWWHESLAHYYMYMCTCTCTYTHMYIVHVLYMLYMYHCDSCRAACGSGECGTSWFLARIALTFRDVWPLSSVQQILHVHVYTCTCMYMCTSTCTCMYVQCTITMCTVYVHMYSTAHRNLKRELLITRECQALDMWGRGLKHK